MLVILGVFVMFFGGCASLDALPDMQRAAASVHHATGMSEELLLLDSQTASAKTAELLQGPLSSDEAVQVALLNNPMARAAMLSVGVSRADFVQSTLFSNPTLALSFRFPDGGGLANFEAGISQNIAELWLIPARKEVVQRQLDRTILNAAKLVAVIAFDARRAYTRAIKVREAELILGDTLGIAERLLQVAELRRKAGTGNEIDVNLARTKKLEAETSLRNARLATLEAHSELARILGISDSPLSLQVDEALPEPNDWRMTPESLQRIATESRLDLQAAKQTVDEAQARANEERVRFWKSVEFGFALERAERRSRGNRNWAQETFYNSLQSGQLTPPNLMPREDQGTDVIVGPTIGIELPLWDQNQAQIAKADRLLEQALQFRDALLVNVAQDIHARLARAKTSAENAFFYRNKQLPAAERSVALSREAYKAGRLPFLSILEAERSYLSARTGYLDAVESAALATVELEQVTGRPAAFLLASPASDHVNQDTQNNATSEVKP